MRNIVDDKNPRGWAQTVIDIFRNNINKYDIGVTGQLYDSTNITNLKTGNPYIGLSEVEFNFNGYGRFVDMGVGKEIYIGNPGDVGREVRRKRKPWYSKAIFIELRKLTEFIAFKYGSISVNTIKDTLERNWTKTA